MGLHRFLLEEEKWNGNEDSGHKQRMRLSFPYEKAVKLPLFTQCVWLCPPIQSMDFHTPIFELFILSVSQNSAHIGSAFDFLFIINMFLFPLLQEHQCLLHFLVWNVLYIPTQLQGQNSSATLLRVLQEKVGPNQQYSFDWSQKAGQPWMVIHIPALCVILSYLIQRNLQTSITLWAAPIKNISSVIKKYSLLQLMNIEEVCSLSLYSLPYFEGLN